MIQYAHDLHDIWIVMLFSEKANDEGRVKMIDKSIGFGISRLLLFFSFFVLRGNFLHPAAAANPLQEFVDLIIFL